MKRLIVLCILAASTAYANANGTTASAGTSGFAASGAVGGGNSVSLSGAAQYNHAQASATKYSGHNTSSASATGSANSVGGGFNLSTSGATGGFVTGGVGTYSSYATTH